ncbi:MAG: 4-hydroxythreonine-4-phosphate dehydrogenase PdxA, partial [Pedosphaera parvula]|nr:4-hydroxythreonine-4-phosphate dehydrogenase PdxA [Pedosphaera parvula]
MNGWIGISVGDHTGIGPEVALKALAAEAGKDDALRYLLIGDSQAIRQTARALGLDLRFADYHDLGQPAGVHYLHSPLTEPLGNDLKPGSPAAAEAALAFLHDGAQRCLRQELDALVTAPVNKESIMLTGRPFIGQTEYLSQLAGTERTAMMLLGQDDRGRWLRVTLATTHVPIKHVAASLTRAKVELAIELTAQACRDLGLTRARIGVCGLNPH